MRNLLVFITFFQAISSWSSPSSVTLQDLRFCPGQTVKNESLHPYDLKDNGQVWRVGNRRWNESWERKYQQWLDTKTIDSHFFMDLGIPTDCGEAVIFLRAIFSRIHNLPASFKGGEYGHYNKTWARLPTVKVWSPKNWKEDFKKDKRFQRAIKVWGLNTGTVHLYRDLYPIALSNSESTPSDALNAGVVYLTSGHAETLINNSQSRVRPLKTIGSSSPRGMRTLDIRIFSIKEPDGLEESLEKNKIPKTGLYRWNWTVSCNGKYKKVSDEDMPYYSTEQFDINWESDKPKFFKMNDYLWSDIVRKERLSKSQQEKEIKEEIKQLISDIEISVDGRKKDVEKGLNVSKQKGISKLSDVYHNEAHMKDPEEGIYDHYMIDDYGRFIPMNERADYENNEPDIRNRINTYNFYKSPFKPLNKNLESYYYEHSSPNRDHRLIVKWMDIKDLFNLTEDKGKGFKFELLAKKIKFGDKDISYLHFLEAIQSGMASPQPWDDLGKRWGEYYLKYQYKSVLFFVKMKLGHHSLTLEDLSSTNLDAPTSRRLEAYLEKESFLVEEYRVLKNRLGY